MLSSEMYAPVFTAERRGIVELQELVSVLKRGDSGSCGGGYRGWLRNRCSRISDWPSSNSKHRHNRLQELSFRLSD